MRFAAKPLRSLEDMELMSTFTTVYVIERYNKRPVRVAGEIPAQANGERMLVGDLPIGSYVSEDGKRRKLGSRIAEAAGRGGGNFLTPEIAQTTRREAAYREVGALIDAERLATNLLSSMPLAFNLLAPWGQPPERASSYLLELLPAFTGSARQLLFRSPLWAAAKRIVISDLSPAIVVFFTDWNVRSVRSRYFARLGKASRAA